MEQRLFTRIPFDNPVRIISADGVWTSHLVDISLKGVLVAEPTDWSAAPGQNFVVELNLQNSNVAIRMEVTVAHRENGRIGFHCEHIDLDSITHLRRLVELNLGSTEILSRELSALGGR